MENSGNILLAVIAGMVAMLVGAGFWAGITVFMNMQIGYMAIGVGLLVGASVMFAGRGQSMTYGIIGAGFAILACVLGNLLAMVGMKSGTDMQVFYQTLTSLNLDTIVKMFQIWTEPVDLAFYAVAVYFGFTVSRYDLEAMLAKDGEEELEETA